MNINIDKNLDSDFLDTLGKLKEKYGKKFTQLQGLDSSKLNFTSFIDNFIDSDNVANASVDSNSNIDQKDIVTLLSEMAKPHKKLLAFNKIYYEVKKKYGKAFADKLLEEIWSYDIYLHDGDTSSFIPYCHAFDIKDIVEKGLFFINNYNAEPAKHLDSFVQILMESIAFLARRQSGAVGLPNLIPYLYYYWSRDVKEGYFTKSPEIYKRQQIQALIYRLNQPWVRTEQSAFTNVSVFDHPYFEAIFGGAQFPDGSFMIDEEEEIIQFQKDFIDVVNEIREKTIFTFPVLTASLLYQEGKFVDEEFARWACEASRKWNLFNFFTDSSVNSLSNCPLSGDTKILYWSEFYNKFVISEIKDIYNRYTRKDDNATIKVLANGEIVECKINHFDDKAEYLITLTNGATIKTTANHLNKVYNKDYIKTSELTVEDYLPYSLKPYISNDFLTFEEGKIVGMFLGDGSFGEKNEITFSLNTETDKDDIEFIEQYCQKKFGAKIAYDYCKSQLTGKTSCVNVRVNSSYLRGLITQFVKGNSALNKELDLRALNCSINFRKGIIDGLYTTDGNKSSENCNRLYTSSSKLKDSLVVLFSSLGIVTKIYEDSRQCRLADNINYTIRWFTPNGRTRRKDSYILDDNYMWIKIKSIEKIPYAQNGSYCLEVVSQDAPEEFMLGNGIVTHNCRLKSNIKELGFFNSIGGTALRVGSVKVATLNIARLAYKSNGNEEVFLRLLEELTYDDVKLLDIVRHIIKRNVDKGLLPNFTSGLIDFKNLYNTIGINGIYETMKTFGYTYEDELGYTYYKPEAYTLCEKMFKVIDKVIALLSTDKDYHINKEQIPAEQAAIKLQESDKILYPEQVVEDLPLYGNQYIPLGKKATLAERTKICAAFDRYCNGGSIEHINVDKDFSTFDQAWYMLNWVAQQGVTYFAFNGKVSRCKNNHSFYGDYCPCCGEHFDKQYTRTVGFYTNTSTWSDKRKEEFKLREWMEIDKKGENA